MGKSVRILSTSPRRGGNSDALAQAFAKGAPAAGNRAEKIKLYYKTIGFCKNCLACQKTKRWVIRGGADAIGSIQSSPALQEAYEMDRKV